MESSLRMACRRLAQLNCAVITARFNCTDVRTLETEVQKGKEDNIALGAILNIHGKQLARVPGKPISANRGLNLANRGIHFDPRLDSVPESMINLNLGIN